jgi:hypothetical protein
MNNEHYLLVFGNNCKDSDPEPDPDPGRAINYELAGSGTLVTTI